MLKFFSEAIHQPLTQMVNMNLSTEPTTQTVFVSHEPIDPSKHYQQELEKIWLKLKMPLDQKLDMVYILFFSFFYKKNT